MSNRRPKIFTNGQRVLVKLPELDHTLQGVVKICAPNGISLIVLVDEGIPVPFGVLDGKQALVLLLKADGYHDIHSGRRGIELQEPAGS